MSTSTDVVTRPRLVLALIGVGPRGAGLLERLVAHAVAKDPGPVEVHLVDPYPPGGGRVWRSAQSELLRLNTTAEDLTAFVDDSVALSGPVTPGPTMYEWCRTSGVDLEDAELAGEAATLGPLDFPTRRLASAYFAYAHERTLSRAPASLTIITHAQRAVDLVPAASTSLRLATTAQHRDVVVLEDGETVTADAVVLLNSHVDVDPAPPYAALADFADQHGLSYVPPAYGGDLDLGMIGAGSDVIVRGFGLGFVDLMILLTEGRGGRFVPDGDGLRYLPSGAEPRLLVGSRRGVPYHCKPMYRLQVPKPTSTTFCTPATVRALLDRGEPVNFRRDLWPLVEAEVTWAYYWELVQGHPERVTVAWPEFAATFATLVGEPAARPNPALEHAALKKWFAEVVPDPADRLDLAALDRPLAGQRVADRAEVGPLVRDYVRRDLARRQDVRHSADLGAFHGFLAVLPVIAPALGSTLLDPRSLLADFFGSFMSLFNFYASGPPPDRLEQLLALEEAGVVSFLGPDLEITADPEREAFVARSSTVPGEVIARSMIDATLPTFHLGRTTDPLLRSLAARGEAVSQVLTGPDGVAIDTGQLQVDAAHRLVRADGTSAPRRFALGMHTVFKAAAFARPGSNGPVHRLNDQVARALLRLDRPEENADETVDESSFRSEPRVALSGAGGRGT